jgi:hypothetical protein
MKTVAIAVWIVALALPAKDFAQTPINKTIPVKSGQNIVMHFDYPKLVRVSTWDKNEISIQGTVTINFGENDDAFVLENTESGSQVNINSHINNLKGLPKTYTIIEDGGKKIMFKDRNEMKKYQAQNGGGFSSMSTGTDIDIDLEIKVPRNFDTRIESVYGMVEIKNFTGPLTVEATYGGVDAALPENAVGELTAETNYGQIYTNLNVKFSSTEDRAFHTYVMAKPGSGPRYSFESKYGNVYLRKPN